ncbi:MAG: RDD family protein [Planctomycetes bacterium]|nr:RDD family protein [Planctomycetota bacterium]
MRENASENESATDPFAPPRTNVEAESTGIELAGRGQRLIAATLDAVVVGLVVLIAGLITAWSASSSNADAPLELESFIRHGGPITLMLLLAVAGANVFTLATRSATLGKVMVGIHVARPNGDPAGFWRILVLRSWVWGFAIRMADKIGAAVDFDRGEEYGVTAGNALWLIGVLFIFLGSSRRCLYDYLADTIVVRTKGKLVRRPSRRIRALQLPKEASAS